MSKLELVDRRGDLDALQQRHLGALEADILWPPHEAGEVLLRHDVTTDGEGTALLLNSILWERFLGCGTL